MANHLLQLISKVSRLKYLLDFKSEQQTTSKLSPSIGKINPIHMVVMFYFIGLAARVAECDGKTNDQEIKCLISMFPHFFRVNEKVKTLYYSALNDKITALDFAKKIRNYYPQNHKLMKQICDKLIEISICDGPMNISEYNYLLPIANIFDINQTKFDIMIDNIVMGGDVKDPLNILEITSSKIHLEQINNAYKKKIKEYHPDKISAYPNIAPIYQQAFNKKYQLIRDAYEMLASQC